MNNKKVAIFDFDGVITDSFDHAYYGRGVRMWPELKPHEYRDFFRGNIFEEMAKMPPSQTDPQEMETWLKNEYFPAKRELPLFQGIEKVLEELNKKYIIVINSSSLNEEVEAYLDNNGIDTYVDAIYGSDVSKNKIEKFKMIFKDYSVDAHECFFVTDTIGDVLDAQQCNIPSLVVTYGYQDKSYFESVADSVIGFAEKPADILVIIEGLEKS